MIRILVCILLAVLLGCGSDRSHREAPAPESDATSPATTTPQPDRDKERYIAIASALACVALHSDGPAVVAERRRLLSEHDMDEGAWLELARRHGGDPALQALLTERLTQCSPAP